MLFKKKTGIDLDAYFRGNADDAHPMAPSEWDSDDYDPIKPGELRRRLEVLDARLEGINTHTKRTSQFLYVIALLGGAGLFLSFREELAQYWPFS